MDMIEPAAVVGLMEETKDRHYDPQRALVDAVAVFGTVQALLMEEASDAIARAQATGEALHEAMQRVQYWRSELDAVHAAAQSAHSAASSREARARQVECEANSVLHHWEGQLSMAIIERTNAQAAVSAASGRLMMAQNRAGSAQSALSSAQSALASCEADVSYDNQGHIVYPNCASYANAVYAAQSQLEHAQTEVFGAECALNGAHQALGHAQARENICTDCRNRGIHAVSIAGHAVRVGRQAVASANDAIRTARDIYPLVQEMDRLLDVMREHADACARQAQVGRNHVDIGTEQFHSIRARAGDNAHDATRADDRLMDKAALMQKFDTRTL